MSAPWQRLVRGVGGVGFRVKGLGFRVWGLGFRVWGLGFRAGVKMLSQRGLGRAPGTPLTSKSSTSFFTRTPRQSGSCMGFCLLLGVSAGVRAAFVWALGYLRLEPPPKANVQRLCIGRKP